MRITQKAAVIQEAKAEAQTSFEPKAEVLLEAWRILQKSILAQISQIPIDTWNIFRLEIVRQSNLTNTKKGWKPVKVV